MIKTRTPTISSGSLSNDDLDRIIQLIPKYDPVATASPGMYFDYDEARSVIAWIERNCTHIEDGWGRWVGRALLLQDWQKSFIANLFGWKRADGYRRYRRFFLEVARKNGKTPLVASLLLVGLFYDRERGAQIYSAAGEQKQAALMFRQMSGMIDANKGLRDRTLIYRSTKTISFSAAQNYYTALSADAKTKHGFNTHMSAVDELHVQPNRDLVDTLGSSMGSRAQPIEGYLTTSDHDRPSICNEIEESFIRVRDGVIDSPEMLPIVYKAEPGDDWTDPEVWKKANPNFGVSVKPEFLAAECKRAQDEPSYLNTFLRLFLNIKTGSNVAWIPLEKWDQCGDEFTVDDLKGEVLYLGADLSTTTDLTALAIFAVEPCRLMTRFYCPEDSAHERERRDRVPYATWARQGHITLTPGNVVDYDWIKQDILNLCRSHRVANVGVDPYNATDLTIQLQREGAPVEMVTQSMRNISSPAKMFERLVMSGKLKHDKNPVMRWMVGNAMIETDAQGNIMPSKKKSTQRIDGVSATVTALARAEQAVGRSVYDDRGVYFL